MICITNVAEDPAAKQEFRELGVVPFLKRMHSLTSSDDIKQRLAHTLRQLDFGHWPYEKLLGAPEEPEDDLIDTE